MEGKSAPIRHIPALLPLRNSDWWVNKPNPKARMRLFCGMGIGSVASTYTSWVSQQTADTYPEIEICVVEYPGHGTNYEAPLHSLETAAEKLAVEIRKAHFAEDGSATPYALFGFSMGANIMYRVAQILGGCTRLYLCGRGPPHIPAPVSETLGPDVVRLEEQVHAADCEAVVTILKEDVLPLFMAAPQLDSYARILQLRLASEDGRKDILRFAESLVADSKIGMEVNQIPKDFTGDIRFYYSPEDETWPLEEFGLYDDITEMWNSYTSGKFVAEEVAACSHEELGGFQSPAFKLVCSDLAQFVRENTGT